jgi:hypothetical protein
MQSFAKNFEREQEEIRSFKMTQIVRRAMALQARAKIKPTSMNPDLLTMSKLRGGSAESQPLELYWPGT